MKKGLITFLIGLLLMTWLVCRFDDANLPIGIITSILVCSIALAVLVYSLIRMAKELAIISVSVILSTMVAFAVLFYQDRQRQENADLIIEKIEAYKIEHNIYPHSLSKLQPRYLSHVPKNYFGFFGRPFIYTVEQGFFSLKMETGTTSGKVWLSSEHAWDHYD